MTAVTPALIADAILVIGAVLAWWSGWRQGAWSSVLSFIGIVAGLVLGMAAAPFLMGYTDQVALRLLLVVSVLVLLVGVGQLVGATLGAVVRDRMRQRAQMRRDSIVGAIFQVVAMIVVVWLVSLPLAGALTGKAGQAVHGSHILGTLNRYMPSQLVELPTGVAAMLNESGLPPLVSPWLGPGVEVDAPEASASDAALSDAIRPAIIHVVGDSRACSRRLMGSGFVAAPDLVVTNAHVVAGTNAVSLDTLYGVKDAEVVYYNPDVDIAVLRSPGLGITPLEWAPAEAATGDSALVVGFPESGPYTVTPVRVRERLIIAGPDIYASGHVERDAYTVRGTIQPGNSGGPLLDSDGRVLGMVFGASIDETDTGYALSAAEIRTWVGDFSQLGGGVDTGRCVNSPVTRSTDGA